MDGQLKKMLQEHLQILLERSKRTCDGSELQCLTQSIFTTVQMLLSIEGY